MTIESLERAHKARPFRPFSFRLADGRELPVPHPEFLAFNGKSRTAILADEAEDPKRSLASLKGCVKYSEWFDGLVGHSHLPATILIEHALREYAENHGYEKPQPRR